MSDSRPDQESEDTNLPGISTKRTPGKLNPNIRSLFEKQNNESSKHSRESSMILTLEELKLAGSVRLKALEQWKNLDSKMSLSASVLLPKKTISRSTSGQRSSSEIESSPRKLIPKNSCDSALPILVSNTECTSKRSSIPSKPLPPNPPGILLNEEKSAVEIEKNPVELSNTNNVEDKSCESEAKNMSESVEKDSDKVESESKISTENNLEPVLQDSQEVNDGSNISTADVSEVDSIITDHNIERSSFESRKRTISFHHPSISPRSISVDSAHRSRKPIPSLSISSMQGNGNLALKKIVESNILKDATSDDNSDALSTQRSTSLHLTEPSKQKSIPKRMSSRSMIGRRKRVANEILTSEKSYIASLEALETLYIAPLMKQSSENPSQAPLSYRDVSAIFANLSIIIGLNKKLLDELIKRLEHEDWDEETTCIGDLFERYGHFFKMYSQYVQNHRASEELIRENLQNNRKFRKFCENVESKPESAGQTLSSYLIMPIQRIPRYRLLLDELVRRTPIDHPDIVNLQKAVELVKQVAVRINEGVRDSEVQEQILDIQNKFAYPENMVLLKQGRKLLKQGPLEDFNRKKILHVIVFDDLLLTAKKSFNGYTLKDFFDIYKGEFHVQDSLVHEIRGSFSEDESESLSIIIKSSQREIHLVAKDKEEKKDWMKVLMEAQQNARESKGPRDARFNTHQRNNSSSSYGNPETQKKKICNHCHAEFSIIRRKIVCEICNQVYCSNCIASKVETSELDNVKSSLPPSTPLFKKTLKVCEFCMKRYGLHKKIEKYRNDSKVAESVDSDHESENESINNQETDRDSTHVPSNSAPHGSANLSSTQGFDPPQKKLPKDKLSMTFGRIKMTLPAIVGFKPLKSTFSERGETSKSNSVRSPQQSPSVQSKGANHGKSTNASKRNRGSSTSESGRFSFFSNRGSNLSESPSSPNDSPVVEIPKGGIAEALERARSKSGNLRASFAPIQPGFVRAISSYEAKGANEISFKLNEIFELIGMDNDNDWWNLRSQADGREGYALKIYFEKVDGDKSEINEDFMIFCQALTSQKENLPELDPENEPTLMYSEGDVMQILGWDDDSYWYASHTDTGEEGWILSEKVKTIKSDKGR